MSSVMLPVVVSPYFKYPNNPMNVYKMVIRTMATLSTPNRVVKFSGSLIAFCRGKIYESVNTYISIKLLHKCNFKIYNIMYVFINLLTMPIASIAKSTVPKDDDMPWAVPTGTRSASDGIS